MRLMPAKDVKAYVRHNKNDAADAEAICEAVRHSTMRFVQIKLAEQKYAIKIKWLLARPKGLEPLTPKIRSLILSNSLKFLDFP